VRALAVRPSPDTVPRPGDEIQRHRMELIMVTTSKRRSVIVAAMSAILATAGVAVPTAAIAAPPAHSSTVSAGVFQSAYSNGYNAGYDDGYDDGCSECGG